MERKIYLAKAAGMTLIELMIIIAIIGIALSIGMPALSTMAKDNTLNTTYNQMVSLTSYARSQASKRNTSTITLCKSSDGEKCSDASSGFKLIVFSDDNGDGDVDDGELLKETAIDNANIKLQLIDFNNDKIFFLASGKPEQTGKIMICDDRSSTIQGLVMNISGQLRKATIRESSCS